MVTSNRFKAHLVEKLLKYGLDEQGGQKTAGPRVWLEASSVTQGSILGVGLLNIFLNGQGKGQHVC